MISHGENIIGHIWIEKYSQENRQYKLGIVIWDKSKRGLGVGKWAIKEVIKIFAQDGYSKTILLNVRKDNIPQREKEEKELK